MRALVWCGPVFEPTGYADEVRGMVAALDPGRVPVCLSPPPQESSGFRDSLGAEHRALFERLVSRPIAPGFIQLQHGTIDCFSPSHPDALYGVGRTMFETDGLPSHWVSGANALDELWVPGAFNLQTFRAAGVRVPMHIIPGGIDSDFFRPDVEPLNIAGLRGTVFLSVFEWRLRKGWDVLLRAWADAFTPDDDVTLVLRAYPIGQVDGRRNVDVINERIDTFLREYCGGRTRADIAPIEILGSRVSASDLPSLYTMANAFVLPTRGEGWGRPFMESMACGVPVIATNWSAHLAFMNTQNSYLVDVDALAPADASEVPIYAGQRWAAPSTSHLISQLRRVHSDRAEANAIGARARQDMVDEWPWSRAADAIAARIADINARLDTSIVARGAPLTHATGIIVEGGHGDPTHPVSNATMWLDALSDTPESSHSPELAPSTLAWRTSNPGPRPSYGSPEFRAWQRSHERIERAALHLTVLDDNAFATAPVAPVHGVWVVDVGSMVTSGVPGHLVTILRDQADCVVVPHGAAHAACLAIGVDETRLTIVPPVVDTARFTPSGAAYRHASTAGTRFLAFGGDRNYRALQRTIAIFDRTFTARDDVVLHIVLATQRPGEDLRWRERTITNAAAGKRHPQLPRYWIDAHPINADELPALYRAADVLIHAGSATGRGRTIREAMSCGAPVIATDATPASELLDEHCGWLVSSGPDGGADPNALAVAMRAATNVAERAVRGAVARERALLWPSGDTHRVQLRALIRELQSRVPRRTVGETVPLNLTPFPFDSPRRVVLLAHVDWHSGTAPAVVRAYAMACDATDDVTLALCLDPAQGVAIDVAERVVRDAMRAAGRSDDTWPDLLLVPDALDAVTLHRLRAATDVVVAVRDPVEATTARNAQCVVVESLDIASWRSAIARSLASLHAA